jgi:hypothetical protein
LLKVVLNTNNSNSNSNSRMIIETCINTINIDLYT